MIIIVIEVGISGTTIRNYVMYDPSCGLQHPRTRQYPNPLTKRNLHPPPSALPREDFVSLSLSQPPTLPSSVSRTVAYAYINFPWYFRNVGNRRSRKLSNSRNIGDSGVGITRRRVTKECKGKEKKEGIYLFEHWKYETFVTSLIRGAQFKYRIGNTICAIFNEQVP